MMKFALTAASLALVATATSAMAGPAHMPKQEVSFADLDLTSAEGQAALDRRVDAAARKICMVDDIRTGTRLKNKERQECYSKARASAANQVAGLVQDNQLGG